MRDILYRGKTYNKRWVYGIPVIDGNTVLIHGVPIMNNTLGEFTGCYDKNKTPIFEGDYVARVGDDGLVSGLVEFADGAFSYCIDQKEHHYKLLTDADLVIVGDNCK